MPVTWKYNEDKTRILLNEIPSQDARLKVTGTRFGAVLGLNKWASPFQIFCEVSKVAKKPFVDTDATKAGNIIEVKQQRWVREHLSPTIKSPEMYYNTDDVKRDQGFDFFKSHPIFGGMWDAVDVHEGNITNVIEFKTTKRPDDWLEQPPIYYQLQVLLYAHLLGVKDATLICSFVDESDYIDPYAYVVNEGNTRMWFLNTETTTFEWEGGIYTIAELVEHVELWYFNHIEKGISPEFDVKKDKEYLDLIQTTYLAMATDLDDLLDQRNAYQQQIQAVREASGLDKLEEDLSALNDEVKRKLSESITDELSKVVYKNITVKRVEKTIADTKKMKEAGVFEEFSKPSISITMTVKKEKED